MNPERACDVENLADFYRYYMGSWVGWHVTDSTSVQPCYVEQLITRDQVKLRPLSKEGSDKYTLGGGFDCSWSNLKDHIDFGVPDIGITPDGPTILFCSYATPRVARKGYRSRETRVAEFNNWEIRNKYNKPNTTDRFDWAWFAFNPEYVSLEKAEDRLSKGELVGAALSRTLGVYSLPKFQNSLLAYKRWTVGHVVTPFLIHLKREYADYEESIAQQTGAEVIVG